MAKKSSINNSYTEYEVVTKKDQQWYKKRIRDVRQAQQFNRLGWVVYKETTEEY